MKRVLSTQNVCKLWAAYRQLLDETRPRINCDVSDDKRLGSKRDTDRLLELPLQDSLVPKCFTLEVFDIYDNISVFVKCRDIIVMMPPKQYLKKKSPSPSNLLLNTLI